MGDEEKKDKPKDGNPPPPPDDPKLLVKVTRSRIELGESRKHRVEGAKKPEEKATDEKPKSDD